MSQCNIASSRCYITPNQCNKNITSSQCYIPPNWCNIASTLWYIAPGQYNNNDVIITRSIDNHFTWLINDVGFNCLSVFINFLSLADLKNVCFEDESRYWPNQQFCSQWIDSMVQPMKSSHSTVIERTRIIIPNVSSLRDHLKVPVQNYLHKITCFKIFHINWVNVEIHWPNVIFNHYCCITLTQCYITLTWYWHQLSAILHCLGAILLRQMVDAAGLFLLLMACHTIDSNYMK